MPKFEPQVAAPDTAEGEQLLRRRYEAMMTLAQLAELTGFNKSTLSRWFRRPEVELAWRSLSERGEQIADTASAGEGDAAPRLERADNVAPEQGWADVSSPANKPRPEPERMRVRDSSDYAQWLDENDAARAAAPPADNSSMPIWLRRHSRQCRCGYCKVNKQGAFHPVHGEAAQPAHVHAD